MKQYRVEKADEVLLNGKIETVVDVAGGYVFFKDHRMSIPEFARKFYFCLSPYSKYLFVWKPFKRVEENSALEY